VRGEARTATGLAAGVDAVVGDAREHGLVAGCQVVQEVETSEVVGFHLIQEGSVVAEQVLRGEVKGVGVSKKGSKFEHVSLVIE